MVWLYEIIETSSEKLVTPKKCTRAGASFEHWIRKLLNATRYRGILQQFQLLYDIC